MNTVSYNGWQFTGCVVFFFFLKSVLFNMSLVYLYFITAPFTNLPLNYTAHSTWQAPTATMLLVCLLLKIYSEAGGV